MVTWEFLQAKNLELAAKLGVPTPKLTPTMPSRRKVNFARLDEIFVSPDAINDLTEDEATFYIASSLVYKRQLQEESPRGKIPFTLRYVEWETAGLLVLGVAIFAAIYYYRGLREVLECLSVVAPLIVVREISERRKRSKSGFSTYWVSALPGDFHSTFREAATLTGNPAAGERYIAKAVRHTWSGERDAIRMEQIYFLLVPEEFRERKRAWV